MDSKYLGMAYSIPRMTWADFKEVEKNVYGDIKPYSDEGFKVFNNWLITNHVFYYGKPRDSFNEREAMEMVAERLSKNELIDKIWLEDLS